MAITGLEEQLKNIWEIQSNTSQYNLQRVCDEIDDGNKDSGGINLKPFYQREYKFTRKDESLLIESLLGGIPIPTIYLASDTTKVPHISNVIDGQHRLMAIHRFFNNKFKLTGLDKYSMLNDNLFSELDTSLQNKLKFQISLTLQFIHVQNNPELELEIFTRYNQGTNPLTKQEIRNVVYDSTFNTWLGTYITENIKKSKNKSQIFNLIKKRYSDKTIHQELYVFFGIFKNIISPKYSGAHKTNVNLGINRDYYSSPDYVIEFMNYTRNLNIEESENLINECKDFLELFIDILNKIYLETGVEYPLSKEIYDVVKRRNQKVQTSILMILTSVIHWVSTQELDLSNKAIVSSIKTSIKNGIQSSQFPKTTSSTTEPSLVIDTIESILNELSEIVK